MNDKCSDEEIDFIGSETLSNFDPILADCRYHAWVEEGDCTNSASQFLGQDGVLQSWITTRKTNNGRLNYTCTFPGDVTSSDSGTSFTDRICHDFRISQD